MLLWLIIIAIGTISLAATMVFASEKELIASIISFCLLLTIILVLIFTRPKTEDPTKESFHKIIKIISENGTYRQISLMEDGTVHQINNEKIYPEGSILRKYGYISKEKWLEFPNKNTYYYEVILPSDEKYEEIKDKIIKIKIENEEIK